jgi:hypothetical protein
MYLRHAHLDACQGDYVRNGNINSIAKTFTLISKEAIYKQNYPKD